MRSRFRTVWLSVVFFAVLTGGLVGCAPRETRVELQTLGEGEQSGCFVGDFNQAYFRRLPGGTWEVVLHSEKPSSIDPTQTITQILYARTFWKPIAGTTAIESSQINARLRYAVLTPPTGVRYDGAAFVTAKVDRVTGELAGRIESGTLVPKYRMGQAVEPFASARLEGTFRAKEDPRAVIQALQTIYTRFGSARISRKQFAERSGKSDSKNQ